MRLSLATVLAAAVLAGAFSAAAVSREQHVAQMWATRANPEPRFAEWVATHGKPYAKDAVEYSKRLATWIENLQFSLEYNAQHTSHWLGVNGPMADLTQDEYQKHLGYDYASKKKKLGKGGPFRYAKVNTADLPIEVDWRAKGAVSEVKNQAQCGSCWAFSATGAVEGINAIVSGKLLSLSEQELVDCDKEQDHGCSGGLMDNAFDFIIGNGGIDSEADYPYQAEDGECQEKKLKRRVVKINGYEDIPENDEDALKKAAAHQPISVAIEADQKAFQLYVGGVFSDETCGKQLDHGVLIVGYGKDPKDGPYWIVKNSWGPEWGDKGFIRMKANVDDPAGLCGIAMVASFPTKTGPNPPDPGPEPGPEPGPTPGPKPGPDVPVKCDDSADCPAGTTCCCTTNIFNMCLQWGCCPMVKATCCEDHQHCCPQEAPVCDTDAGRCLARGSLVSVPWSKKIPARTKPSIISRVFKRFAGKDDARVEDS